MNDKIKRTLAAVAALAALALGGAAIANATSGGGSDQATAATEQSDRGEVSEAADAPDQPGEGEDGGTGAADESSGDGELPATAEQKARAAAERATGGVADGDVEPAEQADPVEDPNDQPTPKGAAYEVEIDKGGEALKVFLDSSFNPIETQHDAG
jgi:hypothetical protein